MYSLPLFPHRYKLVGHVLFTLSFLAGLYYFASDAEPGWLNYSFSKTSQTDFFSGNLLWNSTGNFFDELILMGIVIGGCLWGFSKEKTEDEFTVQIRLNALLWAFMVNYLIVILCTLFIYSFWYLNVMLFNLVTPLVIFLIRYNYLLFKIRQQA